jgi:hypothetical protein
MTEPWTLPEWWDIRDGETWEEWQTRMDDRRAANAIAAGRTPEEIEEIRQLAHATGAPVCYICGDVQLDGCCDCDYADDDATAADIIIASR